jgi:hypothetical protein
VRGPLSARVWGCEGKGIVSALKRTISSSIKEFTTILNNQNPTQKPDGASVTGSTAVQRLEQQKNISGAVFDFGNRIVSSILASTIARYQWPLRGSISMFTGEATTPWHLTIGNPYAPLLSMNNIHVKNVAVTMGKDMGVNDMPRTMEVKVQMRQGRNLGKQEIFSFFGVSYKRQYSKFAASQSTTPTGAAK